MVSDETTAAWRTFPEATELAGTGASQLALSMLELLPDGIALCQGSDPALPLLYANPAFSDLSGWPAGELSGLALATLFRDGPGPCPFEGMLREAAEGLRSSVEQRLPRRDGSRFWARAQALPLSGESGAPILLVLSDISAERAQGEALLDAQKLRSIGELTGGVAHDFNNLLTVIIGHAEAILAQAQDPRVVREAAEAALHTAERAATVTQRMLAFARRQPLAPVTVDLRSGRGFLLEAVRRLLPPSIELVERCESDLWPVLIDPVQLQSAVLSLVANASEAMAEGGRLILDLANRCFEPGSEADSGRQSGEFVQLSVTDSGHGMVPEVARRAIEPFFTTKQAGQGSGLGLSMVYGFVKQSGGHVILESEPGRGTTLRLLLPRARERAQPADAPAPVDPLARRTRGRVLAVEDDQMVRGYVVATLRALGYEVREACSGAEALAILESGERFDVLFTDVVMPGRLGGGELAMRAAELDPRLRVLFTSGYTQDQMVAQQRLSGQAQFLSKPYRRAELAEALRRAMAPR